MSNAIDASKRRRAGHYEVLGETYAKFEFFENGWNPYSRFLDVEKVDLILRKARPGGVTYREVQVKYGKLYEVRRKREQDLFDVTSWRFFSDDEFSTPGVSRDLYLAYILAKDTGYTRDICIFPVMLFAELVKAAIPTGGKRKVCISRLKGTSDRWVLRKLSRFTKVDDISCVDVSQFWRNFHQLE